jgi:hypothetical protein
LAVVPGYKYIVFCVDDELADTFLSERTVVVPELAFLIVEHNYKYQYGEDNTPEIRIV